MKKVGLPWAEEINYWQTSQAAADTWIDKTKALITKMGGKVLMDAYGNDPTTRRSVYVIGFEIEGNRFKVSWPVLQSRTRNDRAERIQAATLLYHDIKAKCLTATILGAHAAFIPYLMLPDGRAVTEVAIPDIMFGLERLFSVPKLGHGEVVEGEVVE